MSHVRPQYGVENLELMLRLEFGVDAEFEVDAARIWS